MPEEPPTQNGPHLRFLNIILELRNIAYSKGNKSLMTKIYKTSLRGVVQNHKRSKLANYEKGNFLGKAICNFLFVLLSRAS